jgi:hypothetical protein
LSATLSYGGKVTGKHVTRLKKVVGEKRASLLCNKRKESVIKSKPGNTKPVFFCKKMKI